MTVGAAGPPSGAYTIAGASLGSNGRFQAMLNQPVTFTSSETHAASWAWDFGDGSTASGQVVTHSFTAIGSPNVTLTITGDGTNTIGTSAAAIPFAVLDPGVLYLGDSQRYQVRAAWSSSSQGMSGSGTAINLTSDTGYFWFFSQSNLEVVIKVLDACSVDGNVWVFAGGLTNLQVNLTVTDTQTNTVKTYTSPEGAFQPLQDTHFEACSSSTTSSAHVAAASTTSTPSVSLATPSPANPLVGDTVSFAATASNFTGTVAVHVGFRRRRRMQPAGPGELPRFGQHRPGGRNEHPQVHDGRHLHGEGDGDRGYADGDGLAERGRLSVGRPSAPVGRLLDQRRHTRHGRRVDRADQPARDADRQRDARHVPLGFRRRRHGHRRERHAHVRGGRLGHGDADGHGRRDQHPGHLAGRRPLHDQRSVHPQLERRTVRGHRELGDDDAGTGPSSGSGNEVDLSTDTGYFWFFDPTNAEVIVKVLDACSVDGHFWIFASGLTNLGVTLTVTDTQSGTSMTYTNTDGNPYAPVQDFTTFNACSTGTGN